LDTDIHSKPKIKYVDFDLPFVLFLQDSLEDKNLEKWADAYVKGEKPLPYSRYAPASEKPGGMIIGGGFPVYLPKEVLAPYYEISLFQLIVGLRTLKRVNPHRDTILMGEIPGDRTGRASFSSVRVMFDLTVIKEEFHWDMQMFCTLAVRAINHFIDHYRIVAARPFLQHVTLSTIQEFHLITELENGQMNYQEFGTSSGPLIGFGGAISEDQDKKLRELVIKTNPPNIHEIMELNIKNYIDLEDWRLAIIEAAVLFEAWLSKYIRDKYTNAGILPIDIDAKFLDGKGNPKSITSIAKNLVIEATGFDFSTTTEYFDWESKVRDLRNDLIHGKRFDVSEQEANDAYIAVQSAINLLSTK
jgi:hypothetical protein